MKQLINEAFNIKNGKRQAKDGRWYNIAYIDPASSDSTYPFRDTIKKYRASSLVNRINESDKKRFMDVID